MSHHDHGLHVDHEGPPWATPIAMLHGFTQHSGCWGPLRDELAVIHHLAVVDLPGHGASGDVIADLDDTVQLVANACGQATYLGYSMGGRVALGLALAHPNLVQRLVLLSTGPGIADAEERAARRSADEALADHVEQVGVDVFLAEWLAQPLFAGLDAERERAGRRTNTAAGLASSLRRCGQGTQPDLRPRLGELEMPVLLVTGARDVAYTGLAEEMAAAIGPTATVVTVPDAGHAVHLERPAATFDAMRDWLRETNR